MLGFPGHRRAVPARDGEQAEAPLVVTPRLGAQQIECRYARIFSVAMYEIAETAGFYGAHGIWSVSDADVLIPLLGYVNADRTEGLERFALDDLADGVRVGNARLQTGRPGWLRAALVVDAFLNLPRGRTDALVIDVVEYVPQRRSIRMAVPYRPHTTAQGFAVYRPKFLETSGFTDPDYDALGAAFFAGVDSHEQAAAVWNAHLLDESA